MCFQEQNSILCCKKKKPNHVINAGTISEAVYVLSVMCFSFHMYTQSWLLERMPKRRGGEEKGAERRSRGGGGGEEREESGFLLLVITERR